MPKLFFPANASFEMVVKDGFENCEAGEGFEYIVGKIRGGELKVVFEPDSPDFTSSVIDGVDGFGFTLVAEV
jgi:hypothetical protein